MAGEWLSDLLQHYAPAKMVSLFYEYPLYEERAVLLRRIKQHDQALHIYVHKLGDEALAEKYCDSVYDEYVWDV
jgi:Vam6/Vps39-like protein vacuolar protein sorting-associated protein 39